MFITIYDLSFNLDTQFIEDLTPGENKTIQGGTLGLGGVGNKIDSSALSAQLQNIDDNMAEWRQQINQQLQELRQRGSLSNSFI